VNLDNKLVFAKWRVSQQNSEIGCIGGKQGLVPKAKWFKHLNRRPDYADLSQFSYDYAFQQ